MLVRKRLNLPRYFILTACLLGGLLNFSSWEPHEVIAMLMCSVGVSLGFFVLVHGIVKFTIEAQKADFVQNRRRKLIGLWFLKFPFMAGVLIGSIHLMNGLVVLPLLLYIGQIVVLFLCLKKA